MPEAEEKQADGPLHRSASAAVIQGVAATGALAYGVGHLAEGVAKLKEAFGDAGHDSAARPDAGVQAPPGEPHA